MVSDGGDGKSARVCTGIVSDGEMVRVCVMVSDGECACGGEGKSAGVCTDTVNDGEVECAWDGE